MAKFLQSKQAGTKTREWISGDPWPDDKHLQVTDTNYAVPTSAVRFVSPTGTNSGSGNTLAAPWQTMAYALANATNGDTIVLRAGVYNEGTLGTGKNLTIQPYPHHQVWFYGATTVTGWVSDTGRWRKDTFTGRVMDGAVAAGTTVDTNTIDPAFPAAGYPENIWIDNVRQTQVLTLGACVAGTFYVNHSTSQCYIGSDPTGKTVEQATHQYCINFEGSANATLRGIGFRRYATWNNWPGAVRFNIHNVICDYCSFIENSGNGIVFYGDNSFWRNCKMAYNGKNGGGSYGSDTFVMEKNRFWQNNQDRFDVFWDCAAVKLVFNLTAVYRDNYFHDNLCGGLWLDITCRDSIIVRNKCERNMGWGISPEESYRTDIVDNWIDTTLPDPRQGNSYAVYIFESNDGNMWNNTCKDCKTNLQLAEGTRTSSGADLAAGATWNLTNWSMNNNVYFGLNNSTLQQIVVTNYSGGVGQGSTYLTSYDYNTYFLPAVPYTNLFAYQLTTGSNVSYASLAAFQAATPWDDNGVQSTTAADTTYRQGLSPTNNGNILNVQRVVDAFNSGLPSAKYVLNQAAGRGCLHLPRPAISPPNS